MENSQKKKYKWPRNILKVVQNHDNKMTLNNIDQCIVQSSSEKVLLVVEGNYHRDTQLENLETEGRGRVWSTQQ